MLSLLPAARRIRGVRPWRPHLFVRALLGGRLGADRAAAARGLLHLLIETQYELRPAWEHLLSAAGGCLCLVPRPSEEEFRRVWRTTLEPPYSFRWEAGRVNGGRDGCGTKHARFWDTCAWAQGGADAAEAEGDQGAEGGRR